MTFAMTEKLKRDFAKRYAAATENRDLAELLACTFGESGGAERTRARQRELSLALADDLRGSGCAEEDLAAAIDEIMALARELRLGRQA